MAELVVRRVSHEEAQRVMQELTEARTLKSDLKATHLETLTLYQDQVKADIEAPNPEQARRIEELRQEILKLQEELGSMAPKAELEEAQRDQKRLTREAEETGRAHEEALSKLTEELRVAQGEENPRVVELREQIGRLEAAQKGAVLRHTQAIDELETQIQELTLAAEDYPRQIADITARAEGEARKAELLQQDVRRYQEAAMEVARLPLDQAATKLEEERRLLSAVEGETAEAQATRAFLAHKISLLEAKQAEHEALQEALEAARQAGAREVLKSPEALLEKQDQLFKELRRQMDIDAELLNTRAQEIPDRLERFRRQSEQAHEQLRLMGDVSTQGADKKLEALMIEQSIANFNNQISMLETLQKTFQSFEEVGRGVAGKSFIDLHRKATEALAAAREEFQRLDEVVGGKDEGAVAVQAEKVRGLEAQVESLQVAVESYQGHTATRVVRDAEFLHGLIALVPEGSRGEAAAYLTNAVQAIAAMQVTLVEQYGAERVAHTEIERLLKDLFRWRGEYMQVIRRVIDSTGAYGGVEFHAAKAQLASFVQQLVRKQNEILRLLALPQDQIAAELVQAELDYGHALTILTPLDEAVDGARDEGAIAAARLEVEFHALTRDVLQTIQREHHQPLEQKMGVIGTMQRLFFSFFSMLFSIPGVLLGGLQTIGSPIVRNPSK
ncbi:MAG: hypothetical protein KFB93_00170 [Simkaniaceae bacterium]|nr:MAG: hypothetical protein KFB93_00170 [Simkaniaceae bacterium]